MVDGSRSTDEDDLEDSFLTDCCFEYDSKNMKWKAVRALEEQLLSNPNNFEHRARLAHFYAEQAWKDRNRLQIALSKFKREPSAEEIRSKSIEHWLWIFANHPASKTAEQNIFRVIIISDKVLHTQVSNLWYEQIAKYPDDARVHWNAANYVTDTVEAISLRKKACLLDPTNPKYPERLAGLLSMMADVRTSMKKSESAQTSAAETQSIALSLREDALAKSDATHQLDALLLTADQAFKAGQYEKANQYAQRIVEFDFVPRSAYRQQNSLHSAHIILGRVALIEGNKEKALECLSAASNIEVEELSMHPPDLVLASELLLLDEKTAVENYLRAVMRFYPSPEIGRLYFLVRFNLLPKSTRLDQSHSKIYTSIWFGAIQTVNFMMNALRINR